jgi:NADPH2:quinone reductase
MRAAFYEETGAARKVLRVATLPDPAPNAGEVLVRVRWSGINPSDVKTRAGLRTSVLPFPRIIPHSDGMGTIVDVGPDVDRGRIGQRVWIWNAAWRRASGTAAELVALPAQQAVPLPAHVADDVGACLGIPAMTALHAVLVDGGVEGKSVLVAGGAGAVGYYAVQFARLLGARQLLTTVSSAQKERLARDAGAETVIDYRQEDVRARVMEHTSGRGVDRVIEVDIAANGPLDSDIVGTGGDVVAYGSGQQELTVAFFPLILKHVRLRFFIVYTLEQVDRDREQTLLAQLLAGGKLRHNIAARLPLAAIADAHELVESGRAIGNVVLQVT